MKGVNLLPKKKKKKAREAGRGHMFMLLRILYIILSEMGTIESDLK